MAHYSFIAGASMADSIRTFSNLPIPIKSNRTADSNLNLEASQVPRNTHTHEQSMNELFTD